MPNLPRQGSLTPSSGLPIYYVGPPFSAGPLPALIYFALSGTASLYEDPFNQLSISLSQEPIRIFSWDLPFHTEGGDYHQAMHQWSHALTHNPQSFFDFMTACTANICFLIENQWIQPNRLGVSGLSRGGFVATHLAAQNPLIQFVLGFSPLTQFHSLEEWNHLSSPPLGTLNLLSSSDQLIQKPLRFYIGNHDTRVGTKPCFEFITSLVETSFAKGIRSPPIELIIYPSIGHRGHGTPSSIFQDGANWAKTKLIK
jgi:hypothetical protein